MYYDDFKKQLEKGLLTWHDEDKSYHDASGNRYDTSGDELLNAELDMEFKDVAAIRLRENPGFNPYTGKVE